MPVSAAASKISCCGQLQISTQEDDRKQGKCNCIYHFVSGEFHLSPFFTSDKIICNSPLSAGAQKAYKGTRLFNLTIQTIFQAWSYFMLLTYTSTRELNATVKEWIAAHMEQFSIECWEWFEIALVQKLTPLSLNQSAAKRKPITTCLPAFSRAFDFACFYFEFWLALQ